MENIGNRFGGRIILAIGAPWVRVDKRGYLCIRKRYLCRCDCGFESLVLFDKLKHGKQLRCMSCSQALRRNLIPIGEKIGERTIIDIGKSRPDSSGVKNYYYSVRCICGETTEMRSSALLKERPSMCAKCFRNTIRKKEKKNIPKVVCVGGVFGRWTIIKNCKTGTGRKSKRYFLCRCGCGKVKKVEKANLLRGTTLECQECYFNRLQMNLLSW